jgi:ATP-dependent RNA helicase DDX3X
MPAPTALIIVPTRELAEQIYLEARKLAFQTGINVVKVYGGTPKYAQIRELDDGADIVIATPGRLIDFIQSRNVTIEQVKYFIIDEADRIMDMGFEPSVNEIVFNSRMPTKEKRLNLFFSATFTQKIKNLANKFMNPYYFVSKSKTDDSGANKNIIQEVIFSEQYDKFTKLIDILRKIQGSILSKL